MDPALLRERELFKKKAFALPVVETRKKENDDEKDHIGPAKKKIRRDPPSNLAGPPNFSSFKSSVPPHNFSILAKIVNSMKERFLKYGDSEPVSFDELLDETNQNDLNAKQRQWLLQEALPNNPRILVTDDSHYAYKPIFKLKSKMALLRLLEKYDTQGLGCISYEDIKESLPNAEKIIKQLVDQNDILLIVRPIDKKKLLFSNPKKKLTNDKPFNVDEEFQKAWRSVSVEGIDESKIEDYLKNNGISSMLNMNLKNSNKPILKRKDKKKKKGNFKILNDHVGDILQDYSDKQ